MEKQPFGSVVPEPPARLSHPRRRHLSRPHRLAVTAIALLATIFYFAPRPNWYWDLHYRLSGESRCIGISSDDIWDSITPSTNLEWHDCSSNFPGPPDEEASFKCARLTVPLDYNSKGEVDDDLLHDESDNKVHVALVLRPAKDGSSSKPPMLINPGGPGGSGTSIAFYLGPAIQAVFGDDQPVIGFDPRGIGHTAPLADCWAMPPPASCSGDHADMCPEDPGRGMQHRMEWIKQNGAYGFINTSDISLRYLDAGHRAVNKLCTARDGRHGGKSILRHASTAHVARDMLSIVDAWDRWVDGETISTRAESEKSKLTYWGFSYGTYLGIKFASMFPDRVGRLMLDGVVDADYYESPVWVESLLDTDKILGLFFEFCADSGSEPGTGKCALYREGDTPESVAERYHAAIDRLQYGPPVTFTHPEYFYPVVLTSELFRILIFSMLYSPAQAFPGMAMLLDDLFEERYEKFGIMFGDMIQMCLVDPGSLVMVLNDAQRAIMCSDKSAPVNQSPEEIRSVYEKMATKSQFADVWMSLMMQCNGWDLFEKDPLAALSGRMEEKIPGPGAKLNTSYPILFLSNTLDPVTPLKAAVKMALRFEGAGLLEQKSAGHCTISAASRCTAKILRGYINEGQVPPPPKVHVPKGGSGDDDGDEYLLKGEWTTCEADEKIGRSLVKKGKDGHFDAFGTLDEELEDVAEMEEEDRELLRAMLKIQAFVGAVPKWEVQKRL